MNDSAITPEAVERAVWIATLCAAVVAIVVTLIIQHVFQMFIVKTQMRLLSIVAVTILLIATYVLSVTVHMVVTEFLVNRWLQAWSFGGVWVHPGLIHKLMLLLAIVGTWSVRYFWQMPTSKERAA